MSFSFLSCEAALTKALKKLLDGSIPEAHCLVQVNRLVLCFYLLGIYLISYFTVFPDMISTAGACRRCLL